MKIRPSVRCLKVICRNIFSYAILKILRNYTKQRLKILCRSQPVHLHRTRRIVVDTTSMSLLLCELAIKHEAGYEREQYRYDDTELKIYVKARA